MAPMIGRNRALGTRVVPAMPTPRRRFPAAALGLVLLAVACAPTPSTPASTPGAATAPPSVAGGPLVTIEVRGGECPEGACGRTTVIERDGRVHVVAPEASEVSTMPGPILEALIAEIETTDFDAMAARPFRGECPTAFDGQEVVFTFVAPSGTHRLASCEVEIDFGRPLFSVAMEAASAGTP